MAEPIEITVNGTVRVVALGTTVAGLLGELGIPATAGRVAVERNKDVVPRAAYEQVVLSDGDHVEVVAFVGGG